MSLYNYVWSWLMAIKHLYFTLCRFFTWRKY